MRIRSVRTTISSAAAVAAALLCCATVLAHGGETFLIAEPALVQPGGGVGVRADLPTSGPVRLLLAGADGTRREVGVVEQTDQGHFEAFIQVPADLSPGQWMLLAEADGRAIASTTIDVAGTPLGEEGGGQGLRDEDDQLLVALPSGWRVSRPPEVTRAAIVNPTGEQPDLVPLVSLAGAVIALTLLVARTRPRRPVELPPSTFGDVVHRTGTDGGRDEATNHPK